METKNKIVNVGIRITRRCNMACNYCNIQTTQKEELTLSQWKEILINVKNLGAKKIVILGGEPTLYPQIVELVDFIINELNMPCSLTTNARDNVDILEKLIQVGLTNIGVSVDNLNLKESISPLKAKKGIDLIDKMYNRGLSERFVNYMVIHNKNAATVEDTINFMNQKKVATYIIPFHIGDENLFDHRHTSHQYAFLNAEDLKNYIEAIDKIINLKNSDTKIINSIEYLNLSKKYIARLNWKCSGLSELRIDSDGTLDCCCDRINTNGKLFQFKDFLKNPDLFFKTRNQEAESCSGCLWPSAVESELERSDISDNV